MKLVLLKWGSGMANIGTCKFYRSSEGLGMGIGLGHCDLSGGQTICEGDVKFCERPDELKTRLQEKAPVVGKDGENPSYKVLIVDDEEAIRKLVGTLLTRQKHQCASAVNGKDGLQKAIRIKFDAVITDIVMPEMDGIALTKELLSLYPKMPVMVMTAHSKEYPTDSALKAGAQDFITKPFEIEDFILRFEKMMRDHEAVSRLEATRDEAVLALGKKS
jgi:CheY-like chemotaxis protein